MELKQVKDWPKEIWERHQAGQALHKILEDLSPYPLARNPMNFEATEIQWTGEERRQIGLPEQGNEEETEAGPSGMKRNEQYTEGTKERWADYEDPMEMDIDLACANRRGTLPKAILAVRTFQIEPGNRETIVEQYRTLWNTNEETWSTAETIIQYMRNAGRGEQESERELRQLIKKNEEVQKDVWEPRGGKRERLAGRPRNTHQHWPKITNLRVHTNTINPDEDIVTPEHQYETGRRHCQVRMQHDQAYSYDANGRLVGTLTKAKTIELYNRYVQTVGGENGEPTIKQTNARLQYRRKHGRHVGTFEDELAALLIRYSSREEKRHRKENLQNHWTLPKEIMEAIQKAFSIRTEVFASPLNVHKDTTRYFSQYPEDVVFGAEGSAWNTHWGLLGAYQFNPEYTAEDMKKAMGHAIAATDQELPVFGVGILPTYAKTPYRAQLLKHWGCRVHQILEVPQGLFTFLPPDHWMGAGLQTPTQCNWNMRIVVVANPEGWAKYCPDVERAHGLLKRALLECPQSKVKHVRQYPTFRPRSEHDKEWHANQERDRMRTTNDSVTCNIDLRPWQEYELPVLKTGECTEEDINAAIENWMDDRKYNDRGGLTTQCVRAANEQWTGEQIRDDAAKRWKREFVQTVIYPRNYAQLQHEERPGCWGASWERYYKEQLEAPGEVENWWGHHNKQYGAPRRRYRASTFIYTDGSKRKVELENGAKEERTGAGTWDPRGGTPLTQGIRWEGGSQTVNRAELMAIWLALRTQGNEVRNEVKICTDSANALHQISNMRARPYAMERHQHRDTLHRIMEANEELNEMGTAVELCKVKAHTGIIGNEEADEAAKNACETGKLVANTDNADTVTLQALLEQGKEEERTVRQKGIQEEVTKQIRREKQATSHRIQAYRRKLETPPEEWGTRDTGSKRRKTTQDTEELEQEMEWLMREQERTREEQEQDERWDNEINEMMGLDEGQHQGMELMTTDETEMGERDLEETMRAVEEMLQEETEEKGTAEKGEGELTGGQNQIEGGEETMHEKATVDPQQETEEILRDLEEEAAEGDRRRRRQEREPERSRIKAAENANPMDGRDQPGPGHGGDTIPHCVDIFMIEGTEMHRAGYNYTQERAKRDVKMIHLIEVTYTLDTEWEKALKDKYEKYAPLVKLLESGNTLYYGSTLCYGVILRYGSDVFVFVRFALIRSLFTTTEQLSRHATTEELITTVNANRTDISSLSAELHALSERFRATFKFTAENTEKLNALPLQYTTSEAFADHLTDLDEKLQILPSLVQKCNDAIARVQRASLSPTNTDIYDELAGAQLSHEVDSNSNVEMTDEITTSEYMSGRRPTPTTIAVLNPNTRSTQFGWSHPIYNGNSWEAPARAPHYPEHTPVAQSWQPFYSAPPPTAPTLGPQRSPLAQPYPPGFQPLYQGARADACSSGSDSDRDTPRSRRRRTRTRAARRDRPQHNPDTDFSLAALRRSIMEEVRQEIRAEMQGQVLPGTEEGLTSSVTPHEGTPEASRVNATRDLDTFFCDLALCSLKQHYLERVFDETKAMRQSDKESASDFFARLDARRDAVNFLAGRVAQCVHMSDQIMLTTFRAGLRYAGKVMRRLHQERLDISKPEEWEQRAREQDFPGTHVALLKLREIADNVETDMESKAADKLAAERASRPSPFSPSANSGRTPFFRNRAVSRPRAPLAVMGDSSVATAAAATSTTPTPASSVAAPGVRSPAVAPPWHQRHPPVVKKLQYAEHLADPGGRVKAWHWRRTRNTLPLEEAVNRVRRALRESPAAARALVDKMTARTRNFAHTRGIRLHTRAAALRTLIQQLQTAMDVEQGLYSAAGRQHHTPLASVPSENLGFAADLCSAWSELSPAEQRQAVRSSPPSSRPGTGPWERMDGGVQWGKPEHGVLAAARDDEGPLLLVFYAHLKGHQVPMAPGDVEKTAFTTQMGSYEWLVMPQGLQNSPSQYQRRMQRALGHLPFVRIFIDDLVVFSNTLEDHHRHVEQLLLTCREKGVFLKRSKVQLLKKSLRFLGHTISADGCRPQHDKVAAVRDWPELQSVTHVRQFLGLAGYYRRFIHCFSEIAQPLTRLTKSDVAWEWGPYQQWAFEELKAALISAPVLALPDTKGAADGSAPFVVQTDASGIALGGVLMQDHGDGLRVIAYESRQFSAAEQNYHTGERELGALHHCTTVTWRHYLIFTNFRLQGDHRPLEWLMEPGRELSRRQARWYMDLVEVGVPRMEYIKGALLMVPDALSRRPDYKDLDAREGLREAGVLDPVSDLPTNPLSSIDAEETLSSTFPASTPPWIQELNSWLAAADTLQAAEDAMADSEDLAYSFSHDLPTLDPSVVADLTHSQATKSPDTPQRQADPDPTPPDSPPVASRTRGRTSEALHTPLEKDAIAPTDVMSPTHTTSSPSARSKRPSAFTPSDRQDWRVRKSVFEKYQKQFGIFDVDACCDLAGHNRQVDRYWHDCLKEQWRGLHVWCNPPYSSSHLTIEAVLRKYVEEWRADPDNTSAVFILPDLQARAPAWRKLFRMAGMRVVEVIPTHNAQGEPTQLFESPDGRLFNLPWPVLVVYAPPSRSQPARIRYPRVSQPVLRSGDAAELRDAGPVQSDEKFLKALRAEYDRPGPLRDLRKRIEDSPHQCTRDFRLVGGVLWRVAAGRYQLVLGEDSPLREVVFWHSHDSQAAGHTGRDKTLERVLRRFWWKGATEDVGTWVASCATCQAVRPRSSYPDGMLNPHSIPTRLWQDVSVDFVTGLPLTDRGNDAFVAFTCKLSKMVHVVPMNFGDSSASTVARIYFDAVWRLHGAPMKIVSDRDPRFNDAFWQELMRLMGVKVARTTPYNLRSDGQAEHTNRVIEDMLRSFVDANVTDWDLFATNVEFAINDSRSEATGYTPFELCCGVSPLSQLDLFLEAARGDAGRRQGGVGTAHEFAAKFSSQLRDAKHRLELAQQRQREQFDRRHVQREYAIGDLVWIEAKNLTEKVMDRSLCRKLTKRWHGPVPVVERFFSDVQAAQPEADRGAPVAYRLRLPPHWRIHDVFAQHRLKPYVSGKGEFAARDQPAIPEAVVVDGQREAHVERILSRRVRLVRGKELEEWKVRWTGYSKAHDQWRTRDKLEHGGPLQQLREFEAARISMEAQVREEAAKRREQRQRHVNRAGTTLAHLIADPCEELHYLDSLEDASPLPWERCETLEDGTLAHITELHASSILQSPTPRILVLFSGTGSVEREFLGHFPTATVVTLDSAEWLPAQLPPVQTDLHGGLPISYHPVAGLGCEWTWNMGNVYGQPPEYPHVQPDEETHVKTDNLDEHGRPLLPLKPYTSGASTDPMDAGEAAVQHQKSSRRRRRSSGPHSLLKNMTSPPRSSGEGSGGGRHTSPTQAVGDHDSDGSGSGTSTSRPSSSRSHGGDLSRRQQRRRKRGTKHREREARRQAQITAKITAEQVEAMERRSREQFQMLLAEQAAANADREKESTDRLKDALSASLTANEFQRDAMGRQREALTSAQAEMAQLRQELGQLIAKRSELEQQLVEPQLHSLTEAAGRSAIDLTPRHAAPHCDSDEVSSAAVMQGSVRSMREDPATRAIVRRRDSVDSQIVHLPSNIEPVSTDRPAVRWDSSSTKYAPPQRRGGKEPANPLTNDIGGDKDGDASGVGEDGDHADDHPGPGERALPSAPRSVAPDNGVQLLVITPCYHTLWMRMRSVTSPDGRETQHFPLTLPIAGPDQADGPSRAWTVMKTVGVDPRTYHSLSGHMLGRESIYRVDCPDHIYAVCVDFDSASRTIAQQGCAHLTEWRKVTAHSTLDMFRESESEQYMEDGLEAVVAVYNSRWYRDIRLATGHHDGGTAVATSSSPTSSSAMVPHERVRKALEERTAEYTREMKAELHRQNISPHHRPSTFPAPSTALSVHAMPFVPPDQSTLPLPYSATFSNSLPPPPVPQLPRQPGVLQAAGPSNDMYTVGPRALKNEQCQLKDVRKLVDNLPEFPSQVKSPEPLDDLEVFAKAVLKLMQHMTVRTVFSSWSCLPERSNGAVMTVADVLAMVSEDRLAKPQQQYLEESAPGGSSGREWQSRYDSTSRFLADLALSLGIPVSDMMRYKRILLSEKQRDVGESAAQFYTRVFGALYKT
ncbi:hypothetical protein CYMTET_39736 [Cymbomonas tetramitiformis]|uniref:RNase H type-1 domain-containing protein n=1 Tax=Cymbomonas tetramitiformis TaxID=36881 RepID=A0AAE0CBQ0_9CHLO|nr:hypothetical protein CYMTET_39736 [Cymbomonas tetramitiformis]